MSTNKLIAAGQSRLKKADDSAVDPAVPADLQNRHADSPTDTSAFAGGRVLGADDVTGTPEEQLAYVTERLTEIDTIGSRAEDFVVLNKAVLLEVAQDRELHLVAGHSNFAQWAGGVLDIEEKYVFELLKDAERIRSIAALGPDLAQHLTKASARKVMSNVITQHGVEVARDVMGEGLAKAAEQGKKRPTAALLAEVAGALQIPPQERSEISDVSESASRPPLVAPELRAVAHAAKELRARVYAPLAPASVAAALAAHPAAVRGYLEDLQKELERVSKRLAAAQRAAAAD
ncbi:hypothetical protein [Streptomyces sp. ID05-18]|uniref:hypothetical protein n=1 Tax=Streptomyces sp. ID05-18 TaxID=3028662 RepID=UPI0029A8DAA7|nr:hypothetical protein [Streptomyces sp. ID05-18]MDX3490974.1 hypothetical protein [Streptomyces sp. ID05-18]